MKTERTWVLIADAGRARILESAAPNSDLKPVAGMTFVHELPPTHELVDDRQPRAFESVGLARHAISGGTDPRRKEKQRFMEELAALLDREARGRSFDRLIIVAPPQALGDLREAFSEAVRQRILREIAKDLTKTPDSEIAAAVGL